MKTCYRWPVSVCTWSLHNDFDAINRLMDRLEFDHVHLDLRPCCIDGDGGYLDRLAKEGWRLSAAMIGFPQEDYSSLAAIQKSGGIVPDDFWPRNRTIFRAAIQTAVQLKTPFLTCHIGFIDHTRPDEYRKLTGRIAALADEAGAAGVKLLLETGQETAADLKAFLEDLNHPALGVNFDPANMLLYGKGDPLAAVTTLAPWIGHLHIKDALPSAQPGEWGSEVVWGSGQAGSSRFLKKLAALNYTGAVAVEREAGDQRAADIQTAIEQLIQFRP